MTLRARRVPVRFAMRIEVTLGAHPIARAAVAGLVDMESMLGARLEVLREHHRTDFSAGGRLEGRLGERLVALGRLQSGAGARFLRRLLRCTLATGEQDSARH